MTRVLYVTARFDRPAGGVRALFRHVSILRSLGWDAAVLSLSPPGARPHWFPVDVPMVSTHEDITLAPDDVVVLPEVGRKARAATRHLTCRRVLFCQNHFYVFQGLGDDLPDWRAAGVTHAMFGSGVIRRAVEPLFAFDGSAVVRYVIDRAVFRPAETRRLAVAYMPRKFPEADVALIKRAFRHRWPALSGVPWVALDGRTEAEVAAVLGGAAVFLSLSRREGLGLPPLEAMSAGCLVAGFTGLGGREFATRENGFWVAEDDLFGAAHAVGHALMLARDHPRRAAAMRRAGQATLEAFSHDGLVGDLRAFWTPLIGPPPVDAPDRSTNQIAP